MLRKLRERFAWFTPSMSFRHFLYALQFPVDKPNFDQHSNLETYLGNSQLYLSSIKNKFKGQRGFVIGNGPSLRFEDLERIKNEVSIASNKIYLAFDEVSWRPDFLTVADPLVWQKVRDVIWTHHDLVMLPSYLVDSCPFSGDAIVFRDLGNASDLWRVDNSVHFSSDLSKGAFGGYTVTYENLQLAVHLGLNPIYIIGCDHYYKGESETSPNLQVSTLDASNHFISGYRSPGEIVNAAPIEQMNESYRQARIFCDSQGIQIFNATRGGHLEEFERANFDDLFLL